MHTYMYIYTYEGGILIESETLSNRSKPKRLRKHVARRRRRVLLNRLAASRSNEHSCRKLLTEFSRGDCAELLEVNPGSCSIYTV